jgi:hypothetical protein
MRFPVEIDMSALFISGWSQAYGTESASVHVVRMLFMSLNVLGGSEFSTHMLVVVEVSPS